jgi:hypothetical protein
MYGAHPSHGDPLGKFCANFQHRVPVGAGYSIGLK